MVLGVLGQLSAVLLKDAHDLLKRIFSLFDVVGGLENIIVVSDFRPCLIMLARSVL